MVEEGFLRVFCCVVDWHGALILFLLSCGWLIASRNKDGEAERLRGGLPCSHLNQSQSQKEQEQVDAHDSDKIGKRPSVFIIVPAKGLKQHSLRNWRTFIQSALSYQGACEILFCVESSEDEAAKVVLSCGEELLQQQHKKKRKRKKMKKKGEGQGDGDGDGDGDGNGDGEVLVNVKVCGQARTCSQKLHNMVSGIDAVRRRSDDEGQREGEGEGEEGKAWDYVLFLDDDVKLHGRLLDNLVDTLEHNPKAFMCTAYPFDVPASDSGFIPYCVAAYHLRLIIAFSLGHTTTFVWGGCMLFRTQDLVEDAHALVSSWRNGGYSDDLIASSISQKNKLTIMCNPSSILLQELPEVISFQQYWNYMSRQVFVLDTYTSRWHKMLNHLLIGIHVYLSLFFLTAVLLNLFRYVYAFLATVTFFVNIPTMHNEIYQYTVRSAYTCFVQWIVRHISAIIFSVTLVWGILVLRKFFKSMDGLFSELYSSSSSSSSSSSLDHHYNLTGSKAGGACGKEEKRDERKKYSLEWTWVQHVYMWLALCIDITLFVPAAANAIFMHEIEWSGIKYSKKDGLINKVIHKDVTQSEVFHYPS